MPGIGPQALLLIATVIAGIAVAVIVARSVGWSYKRRSMKRHTPVIGDDAAQVDRRWKELISEVKKSGSPAASKALKQWLFRYCFEVTESYTLRDPTDVLHQLEALISEVKRLPPCDSIERELPGEVGFQLFDPLDALKLPELPEPQARAPLKYHEETLGHRTPFVGGSPEARFREEENRRLRRR